MTDDERLSRRRWLGQTLLATAAGAASLATGGCSSQSTSKPFVDFSKFDESEDLTKLQEVSIEYQKLIDAWKAKKSIDGFIDYAYDQLGNQPDREEGEPFLVLSTPSYSLKGLNVEGMKIDISSKEALAQFIKAVHYKDMENLATKPAGATFNKLRDNNKCGGPAER